jgi:hypothetical protein
MSQPVAQKAAAHVATPDSDSVSLGFDLIWGVAAIAVEINRNQRQTFHMLENGKLPACKVGGRWCASRAGLRQFFAALIAGKVA